VTATADLSTSVMSAPQADVDPDIAELLDKDWVASATRWR
jgi:chromosome condensin MukBEF complex kleisin-like MukF subunit